MTITTDYLKTRLAALTQYGVPVAADITTIISDSLREYIVAAKPIVGVVVVVGAGDLTMSIPALIRRRLRSIVDSDGSDVTGTYNKDTGVLTFATSPSVAQNMTVYGVPAVSSTSVDLILAALDDSVETVLWRFVRASYAEWAGTSDADSLMQSARVSAMQDRILDNQYPGLSSTDVFTSLDSEGGSGIGDYSNDL